LEALFPQVAAEWHPTFNGNLSPTDVSPGSSKKVWWKCSNSPCECHVWEARIDSRTRGRGCSYCNSGKACPHYNLEALFPQVAVEWHPTYNGNLRPEDVSPYCGKKV
jgi:hypothetical protein